MRKYLGLIILVTPAAASAQSIAPGRWDIVSTAVDLVIPGAPGFLLKMMKGRSKTEHKCVTPVSAETGTATAPHTTATAEQRQQLNSLLAQFGKATDAKKKVLAATQVARSYENVQRFDSAGYFYEQVAALQPGPQATQQAADAYYQAYSFAATDERQKLLGGKARDLYTQVLARQPDNLDAKTNLGMTLMSTENPVQGVTLLREVLATDPRNEKALYNLGVLAVQSGQFDKAMLRFQELVKVNPKNVSGQFYLGIAAARTGAKDDARAAFLTAKSLSADPALAASVDEELAKLK